MGEVKIERRRGGWFVFREKGEDSGPWHSEEAAEAAADGDYIKAHEIDGTNPGFKRLR